MSDERTALIRKMAKRLCEMNDDRWSDTVKDGLIYRERAEELLGMVLQEQYPASPNCAEGRFRSALRSIAANTCCDNCQEAALVAKAALAEPTPSPTALSRE